MKKLVVIDAGHGGQDTGAESVSGVCESHMALSVAKGVKKKLEGCVDVLMTRSDDTFLTLGKRSSIANEAQADAFCSIHFNSSENTLAQGWEVFSFSSTGGGRKLASCVGNAHANKFKNQRSRGLKHASLSVLRRTKMPACLWEGGFMSHVGEASWINNPVVREEMAEAIAQGILDYLQLEQVKPKTKSLSVAERIQRIEDHLNL